MSLEEGTQEGKARQETCDTAVGKLSWPMGNVIPIPAEPLPLTALQEARLLVL